MKPARSEDAALRKSTIHSNRVVVDNRREGAWASDAGFRTARRWASSSTPQIVFGQQLTVNRRPTPNVADCVRQSG